MELYKYEKDMLINLVREKLSDLKFELNDRFYSYSLGRQLRDEEMGKKKLRSKQACLEKRKKYNKLLNKLKEE